MPNSKLTDGNGEAIIMVSNPDLLVNAGTISATTIPKDSTITLTASRNFEFLTTSDSTSPATLKLSASILHDSTLVTGIKVDETVQL